jgi:hypothetical protein
MTFDTWIHSLEILWMIGISVTIFVVVQKTKSRGPHDRK